MSCSLSSCVFMFTFATCDVLLAPLMCLFLSGEPGWELGHLGSVFY